MLPHTDNLFNSTEISIAMNDIIKLFDREAFLQETSKKEKQVVLSLSKLIVNSNGESFLTNFSDEANEDLISFYSEGIINPENFLIKDHLRGIVKVFDDNNIKIQAIFDDHIKEIEANKKKFKDFDVKIDIVQELHLLNKMFPYDVDMNAWKFPIFTLYHETDDDSYEIDFDGIYFKLNFSRDNVTNAMIIAVDNKIVNYEHYNNDDNDNKYFHPHIGLDRKICFGDASAAAQLFWERKEIFNLAMLMSDTLGAYNHASPYRNLKQWADKQLYECASCGESVDEDHVLFISSDVDIPACRNCAFQIDNDIVWKDNYVHSDYHGQYLLKTSATEAWIDKTHKDHIFNILANPDFFMCSTCNEFSLMSLFTQNKCERCQAKEVAAA